MTFVSIIWNLILTVVQIFIGIVGNSQALVADGMHTLSDLATDFMVLYALKHGKKAPTPNILMATRASKPR